MANPNSGQAGSFIVILRRFQQENNYLFQTQQLHIDALERQNAQLLARLEVQTVLLQEVAQQLAQIRPNNGANDHRDVSELGVAAILGIECFDRVRDLLFNSANETTAPVASSTSAPIIMNSSDLPTVPNATNQSDHPKSVQEPRQSKTELHLGRTAHDQRTNAEVQESLPSPNFPGTSTRSTGLRAPKRKTPPGNIEAQRKNRSRPTSQFGAVSQAASQHWAIKEPEIQYEARRQPVSAPVAIAEQQASHDNDASGSEYAPGNDDGDATDFNQEIGNNLNVSAAEARPRYRMPRDKRVRTVALPPDMNYTATQLNLGSMPKTVAGVYRCYTQRCGGTPSLKYLEEKYGNSWRRLPNLQDAKYVSNHVHSRKAIVDWVDAWTAANRTNSHETCSRLDDHLQGRMTQFRDCIRGKLDPFATISPRLTSTAESTAEATVSANSTD